MTRSPLAAGTLPLPGAVRAPWLFLALLCALAALLLPGPALAEDEEEEPLPVLVDTGPPGLTLGTGGVTGLYFPAGGAIAAVLTGEGIVVHVEPTGGSLENLVRLHHGDLALGIAESDRVHQAMLGLGPFARGEPFGEVRALAALHAEPLTLLVRADGGIGGIADLAGRALSAGPADGPAHEVLRLMLEAAEIEPESIATLAAGEQIEALCAGEIDLAAVVSGHPTGFLQAAFDRCDLRLLPLEESFAQELEQHHPYLSAGTIAAGLYPGVAAPVTAVGPVALLVTTADLPEETAYAIVRALCDAVEALRAQHPALAGLSLDSLLGDGIAAPLHPGAARYFTEAGMM